MTFHIRKITPSDYLSVLHHVQECYGESDYLLLNKDEFARTAEQQKKKIISILSDDFQLCLVALSDSNLVGMINIWSERTSKRKHEAFLGMSIRKQFWKQRIGTKLCTAAIEWCKNRNYTQIFLETAKTNIAAIRLFEKFGFKLIGIREKFLLLNNGESIDFYQMSLKLNN